LADSSLADSQISMRALPFSLTSLPTIALAWASVSCGLGTVSPQPTRRPERILHKWYDDGGEGKVSIRISLSDQIAEFKRGGRDIGWCYVATGKEGHSTRPGSYSITEKIEDKYSNIYGWLEDEAGNVTDGDAKAGQKVPKGMVYVPAPMPYWMRLTSYGVGMHGGLIPEPGEPASHGCIRMPKAFVATLFDAVKVGTPVTITNSPSSVGEMPVEGQLPQQQSQLPQQSWSTSGGGAQSVDSVTYRNGQPISYQ
jgi:L,D-transpeptidase catalytic domain